MMPITASLFFVCARHVGSL